MDKQKKILITSALPYVNNVPHLGNIVGSVLPADIINRYYMGLGRETLYICGADEYGTATEVKALEEGLSCREICDKYIEIHRNVYDWFGIEFDYFGRTSTSDPKADVDWTHTVIAQDIFRGLADNGFLEEKTITQLYSEDLDMFVADRFIVGTCPKCGFDRCKGDQCDVCGSLHVATQLVNPRYKFNQSLPLIQKDTDHLFLDLPKLEERLNKWYEGQKSAGTWAPNAISITDAWLRDGLKSRCITRDLKWGTPVPDTLTYGTKYKDKVMYNWFDAPIGYISITATLTDLWKDWWLNPEGVELIQTFSKDNVVFHTIIFPSSLIGTDKNYTLVSRVASCDYLYYDGGKFSKSENRGIFGDTVAALSKKLEITTDYWRYYLIKIRPETKDSDFNWEHFVNSCNADLFKNFGNFVNRSIQMAKRYCSSGFGDSKPDPSIMKQIQEICKVYHSCMDDLRLRDGLTEAFKITDLGNKYLNETEPWVSHKSDPDDPMIKTSICTSLVISLIASYYLTPFIPEIAGYVSKYLDPDRKQYDTYLDPVNVNDIGQIDVPTEEYTLFFKPLKIETVMKLLEG